MTNEPSRNVPIQFTTTVLERIFPMGFDHEQVDQHLVRVDRTGRGATRVQPTDTTFTQVRQLLLSCSSHRPSGLRGSEVLTNGAAGEMLAEEPGQE